jgi:predicted alpha/beta-fold hydrolase
LSKYRPPFLAASTLQVLINEFVASDWQYKINYKRKNLILPNKATVSVDWATPTSTKGKRKVCCLFAGLGGGSDRGYIKSLGQGLLDAGFEVAVLHIIGTGNTPYSSPHFADFSSNFELNACLNFV